MVFLNELAHLGVVVAHVISVVIAVGAVTVTDYLHIIGLRKQVSEKKLLHVYPQLSKMITWSLIGVVATGIILFLNNPSLWDGMLFRIKALLVLIVILNGFVIHKKVYPDMVKCIETGKNCCKPETLVTGSIVGSISVVTWYSIFILALTKTSDQYDARIFLIIYAVVLAATIGVAYTMEKRARKC